MTEDDISYYRQRAETELERAQHANRPEVVRPHFMLAEAYLQRIAELESPEKLERA
ncbi:hypothetical protein [Sphingomonas sp. CARO-RG-8B-R24-01]|uniref:hypothetical protein n=1 Tax=Sphingomonas sp. CARO-RG-8B-R24-01 TaxID=2914831 RepID=UPI001F59B8F7|nr:hypothetical protein [Sphingomonas sp. CARO-RG-8B-R24-01]